MSTEALPIQQLSRTIVDDLVDKLKLDSSSSVSNIITKELQSLSSSIKGLVSKPEVKKEANNTVELLSTKPVAKTPVKEEPQANQNSLFEMFEGPLSNINKLLSNVNSKKEEPKVKSAPLENISFPSIIEKSFEKLTKFLSKSEINQQNFLKNIDKPKLEIEEPVKETKEIAVSQKNNKENTNIPNILNSSFEKFSKFIGKTITEANNKLAGKQEKLDQVPSALPVTEPTKQTVVPEKTTKESVIPKILEASFEKFNKIIGKSILDANIKLATGSQNKPTITPTASVEPATDGGEKSELEKTEKPKEVIITGFGPEGKKVFDGLPKIIEGPFKELLSGTKEGFKSMGEKLSNLKQDFTDKGLVGMLLDKVGMDKLGPLLPVIAGATAILGGLAALVAAFQTDDETKGTLSAVGKAGIKGGLFLLMKKGVGMALKIGLKRIPIIGSIISYGLAYQRFTNGETIAGVIELVSGTVGLIDLVAPGVGSALSLGVDVLQAVLDAKTGGASPEADAKKGALLLDWAKTIGKKIEENFKYVPILGPAYELGKAIGSGNIAEAIKQLIYMFPPFQWIGLLIGDQKVTAGIQKGVTAVGNVFDKVGKWINENVVKIPFIGPAIKGIQHLINGEWKEGLELLPGGKMVYDFFTSNSKIQEAIQTGAPIIEKLKKWFMENAYDLPYIGPAIKGIQLLNDGEIISGLEQLVQVIPGMTSILAFFGNESAIKNQQNAAAAFSKFDWSVITNWIKNKGQDLPVIGPMLRAAAAFKTEGGFLEGLKQLAYIFPGFEILGAMLGDKKTGTIAQDAGNIIKPLVENIGKKIADFFSNIFDSVIGKLTSIIPDFVKDFSVSGVLDKAKGLLGFGEKEPEPPKPARESRIPSTDPAAPAKGGMTHLPAGPEETSKIKPTGKGGGNIKSSGATAGVLGDAAIDPEGGLMVSSPKLGSLYQLHKKDSIVAAPMVESKQPSSGNTFGKAEIILERIAGNTGGTAQNISNLIAGFNNLAKALERTLGETAKIPLVVNTNSNQGSSALPTSFYANAGNGDTGNFRAFVEGARALPA